MTTSEQAIDYATFFPDYSKRDFEIVDYGFYRLPQYPQVAFRGPPVPDDNLASGDFFTIIGAAQTVGVYVQEPFPQLLAEHIGIPALNLGLGGVTPAFYANHPELARLANQGRFVILQVMTARSQSNSRMKSLGITQVEDLKTGRASTDHVIWDDIIRDEPENLTRFVAESRASWREDYSRLIAQFTVPVILLYFAYKPVGERTNFEAGDAQELYGSFPQFVLEEDVEAVKTQVQGYAECRSSRNLGHPLVSRFTGEPVTVDYGAIHASAKGMVHTHNHYYPTAEMHQDAVQPLVDEIRRLNLT